MSRGTGLLIQQLREQRGLSVTGLGKLLGVNKSSVSKWESTGQVSIEHLYQLARYFRITVQELVDGKLHTEGNPDYFKRNYDLSIFNLDKLIEAKDEEQLVLFYQMCTRIKERFLKLIHLYANDKLRDSYLEEFLFLEEYVCVDNRVLPAFKRDLPSLLSRKVDKNHMDAVRQFLKNLHGMPKDVIAWEMEKLVYFRFDLKIEKAIELQSIELLKALLPLLNQSQKDILLEENISKKTLLEISKNPFIPIIVNGGANVLYGFRDFHPGSLWDEEMLPEIEGPITEDNDYSLAPKESEFNEKDSIFFAYRRDEEWKNYSYLNYQSLINKRKTNQLIDLINLKYQKPKKYYENLIAGKYDSSF